MPAPRNPFDDPPPELGRRALPWITVMIGSLFTVWPLIAAFPLLQPFGLLMLLAWRLMRRDVFPIWAALPLGLFDDLVRDQSLGAAMLLWTLCFFMIDLIEQRVVFRDFWQDWLIATGSIGFVLLVERLVAVRIDAHVDTALVAQFLVSVLLFPLAVQLAAALDRRREGA